MCIRDSNIRDYVSLIAPGREEIVQRYTGELPIFDNFGITKQVDVYKRQEADIIKPIDDRCHRILDGIGYAGVRQVQCPYAQHIYIRRDYFIQ